jgi:toxin YoeB
MVPKPNLQNIFYTDQAKADLAYWLKEDPKKLQKISELIESIMADPTQGIGLPKPLKYSLEGAWSRRISHEHRLVYTFTATTLNILQVRHHY